MHALETANTTTTTIAAATTTAATTTATATTTTRYDVSVQVAGTEDVDGAGRGRAVLQDIGDVLFDWNPHLRVHFFPRLRILDLCFNGLTDLGHTLASLDLLEHLTHLSLMGNPLALVHNYRAHVLARLPQLEELDEVGTDEESPRHASASSSASSSSSAAPTSSSTASAVSASSSAAAAASATSGRRVGAVEPGSSSLWISFVLAGLRADDANDAAASAPSPSAKKPVLAAGAAAAAGKGKPAAPAGKAAAAPAGKKGGAAAAAAVAAAAEPAAPVGVRR
jgi:hypothetical protein